MLVFQFKRLASTQTYSHIEHGEELYKRIIIKTKCKQKSERNNEI